MFQKICIKPNEQSFPTDLGFIAETLLYYQKVDIIAGTDTIPILINNCGVDTLIELLSNRNLRVLLSENLLGVANQQNNLGQTLTDVLLVSSPSLTQEEIIYRGIFKSSGRRGYSKRVTQKLLPYIQTIRYQNDICDLVREDISNSFYFKQAIIDTVKFYNPSLTLRLEEIDYKFIQTNGGFLFETNLNYDSINKSIPNNPDGKLINPTSLILNILETRGDMHLASELNAEIATSNIHTELMKIKFQDIYKKTTQGSTELFQFNDFVLSHGHAIREIINNGDKNFGDFFNVLDKADKFREWLKNIGDDKSVIQEYHKAVTSDTWVDKLPSKIFRWSFFTGAGIALDVLATGGIGTAIGLGLSVGDAFLLDKVAKGWKPNVFIENQLKTFVEKV
jgi:hypothetical protein